MPKFIFITLGCPKNTVDSEVMAGCLLERGFEPVATLDEYVDYAIVNTCGFILPAKEESIDRILELAEYKQQGKIGKLVVAGCLVQRYINDLKKEIPEIDYFVSLDDIEQIVDILENNKDSQFKMPQYVYSEKSPRILSNSVYEYVKISEGCNHSCSFCAIPGIRGRLRSRSIDSIVNEVKNLVDNGYKEIILISQDSTMYGADLGMKDGLAKLLEQLDKIEGDFWIRVMYLFPGEITDYLLKVMANSEKICNYIDIPLQHASKRILKSMRRPGDGKEYLKLIDKIRDIFNDDVFIRTALIVGYPDETEEEFYELKSFVEKAKFNHLGVFTYSHEEDTPAFSLNDNVSEDTKVKRMNEIMEMQKEISYNINKLFEGRTLDVVVEGYYEETEYLLKGRHKGQAPDIDGVTLINEGFADVGDFKRVLIEKAMYYDILGKIL
ncbi:ribosomal protein S12 methylthiotransferase [Thermotomaculum hydrothermale]|uniref:Ribosomal protein uS12 methylthiotransferase RimO n=1 Tax=Thermotomaculum hydrothermale TaxID=981385 RepID=A0A7R6PTJ2_9BACT|nr:30S ribosomal protein S12 methylthiotransferase RimO [Thermotomaculum hydrothermale]BBB32382.1 ribosomal protein S12 methylthiotransferase [Thermotomaculum hydrothermale]